MIPPTPSLRLYITFLTLLVKLLGLQERVPKESAGGWFQNWMALASYLLGA
jgi:hypothetical protein